MKEVQAIVYGAPFEPFVESIVRDVRRAGAQMGCEIDALTIEQALQQTAHCALVERLYVLPFDVPEPTERPGHALRRLFPRAEIVNPPEAHELCWDKLVSAERLLARGIPVPESLFTDSADEVRTFVRAHTFAILKERRACGGQGHVILCDTDDVLVGEARGRRFAVELGGDPDEPRTLRDGVLRYPPPFYVQRLIGSTAERGRFHPAQILRAYVLHGRIAFWTERYRERYTRPSDWIINVGLGARYRFLVETSEEVRKIVLRAADVLGIRVGAVDIIRTGSEGPYILEADTDGYHMYIDRQFKTIPEYRHIYDLDQLIAKLLTGGDVAAGKAHIELR